MCRKGNVYDKDILVWYTEEEINDMNNIIKHERDYLFSYG